LFIAVLFISSCNVKTDKQLSNELAGEWVLEFNREGEIPGQFFLWKFDPMDKNSGNYEFYWKADYPVKGNFVVITGEKGTYRIEDDVLYPTPRKFGSQQAEPMSEIFYDTIIWYGPGDPEFELFQATDSIGISTKGSELILRMDNNGDGDWLDEDEETVFKPAR
jgi:hypothetical protein